MAESAGHLDTGELSLAWQSWSAEDPRWIALIAHGYGEHVGRYADLAATLAAGGALVIGPDHRGHGSSDGERALITDLDDLADDLRLVADTATGQLPGAPVVLVGHALGGLVAIRYLQRHGGLAGLVLSGPVIGAWSPALDLLALPEIPDAPLDSTLLSRDPAVGAAYDADPFVYHGPFLQQTLRAIAGALVVAGSGGDLDAVPTLWLHGQRDALVLLTETTAGLDALTPSALQTRIYRDALHEVFHETNRAEVFRDTTEFIRPLVGS